MLNDIVRYPRYRFPPGIISHRSVLGAARRQPSGPDLVRESTWIRGARRQAVQQFLRTRTSDRRVDEDAREGGQEFVTGGYTRGTKTFDALVFGYYEATN